MSDKAKKEAPKITFTLTNRMHIWPIVCQRDNEIALCGINYCRVDV